MMLPWRLAWANKCFEHTAAITIGVNFMMMVDGCVEVKLNGSI